MEKRRLGKTEHMSSIVIFGGAALGSVSQREADHAIQLIIEHGVNHIDVAPSYGDAEVRLGPWMNKIRKNVFLSCKTAERTKIRAREELHRSLERLKVGSFDLYQLHAVDKMSDLETALGSNGAMEAIIEARDEGLLRFIGITGHNLSLQIDALTLFDFDTVMFPLNFIMYSNEAYRKKCEEIIDLARKKDMGVMAIKTIARGNWGKKLQELPFDKRPYSTWYEPFDTQKSIDDCLHFALSQDISSAVIAGDTKLLQMILDAAERYQPMSKDKQFELIKAVSAFKMLAFPS
ncbi:MAG: aldo/keto reductase [Actinobacteria bacterium]|nr:aldo/keto reductase [Actinomycetota bacterium]